MTAPLAIWHHERQGKHWFKASRGQFNLTELKTAPIAEIKRFPS